MLCTQAYLSAGSGRRQVLEAAAILAAGSLLPQAASGGVYLSASQSSAAKGILPHVDTKLKEKSASGKRVLLQKISGQCFKLHSLSLMYS